MCLKDPYGRIIDYLRVSVTDRCNLNCAYCRPENSPFLSRKALLTSEEILAFCREAAILGIRHIKITGGEPLLRTDCCSIVEKLKKNTRHRDGYSHDKRSPSQRTSRTAEGSRN